MQFPGPRFATQLKQKLFFGIHYDFKEKFKKK